MNIANWISLIRIAAFPFLALLVFYEERTAFLFLLAFCLFTDVLDGFLARRLKIMTELGTRLDSWGDLLTYAAAFAGIVRFEADFISLYLPELSAVAGLYIAEILLAMARYGRISSFHTYLSKGAAVLQGIFILLLFSGYFPGWLFYVTASAGILACLEEITLVLILREWQANVKGLYWVLKGRNSG